MTYNDIETASRDELTELQTERLQQTVEHVYENVPWYRDAFEEAGVAPEDIESVDDISKLPFTTKEHIRDNYPDKLFAVDHSELRRVHASSGTTGKPKIVAYTEDDLGVWHEVMARVHEGAAPRPLPMQEPDAATQPDPRDPNRAPRPQSGIERLLRSILGGG